MLKSSQYATAQHELVEEFLREIKQLDDPSTTINLNNIRQLDAFLTHIELIKNSTYTAPPLILHILLTLACRCSVADFNKSTSSLGFLDNSSEYMRQVESDYNHSVHKQPLGERAGKLVVFYIEQATLDPDSRLFANLESVFSELIHVDVITLARYSETPQTANKPAEPTILPVEVISDSEDSDLPIVPQSSAALLPQPKRTLTSLHDVGKSTSGLGESAALFRDIPHISKDHTPSATPEPGRPTKKSKTTLQHMRVLILDEPLLVARMGESLDFWSIIRWCFYCADISSKYQAFLFNSHHTHVHQMYLRYHQVLLGIFRFLRAQNNHTKGRKRSLLSRLMLQLGTKIDWDDRAVEFIFTGSDIPTHQKSLPIFERERHLLNNDPTVAVSQCKTSAVYTDNQHLMGLRYEMTAAIYELKYGFQWEAKLSKFVADKLVAMPVSAVESFFFRSEQDAHDEQLICEIWWHLMLANMNREKANKTPLFRIGDLDVFGALDRLSPFSEIADNLSISSFPDFLREWERLRFLLEWALRRTFRTASSEESRTKLTTATLVAKRADTQIANIYREFLASRDEDTDIAAEDTPFFLLKHEMKLHKTTGFTNFAGVVAVASDIYL